MKKKNLKSLRLAKMSISNFGSSIKGGTITTTNLQTIGICTEDNTVTITVCPPPNETETCISSDCEPNGSHFTCPIRYPFDPELTF